MYKPFPNRLINISDWWYTYPSKKYEFVSWDDSSQLNGQIKNIPNHHDGTSNSGKKKRDKEPESPGQYKRMELEIVETVLVIDLQHVRPIYPAPEVSMESL